MAKLIYTGITSLDGYVADADGRFEWSAPDETVHAFVNDLERPIGTYLYGRRLYDVMRFWETVDTGPDQPAVVRDYARLWRDADKVVYSTTLPSPSTTRTRIERSFDADSVRQLKADATRDISVGGPGLAEHALRVGLVDELHQFLTPVVVGGGTAFLPYGVRLDLELLDQRSFGNGVVHLHYAARTPVG
jgi:dihydrofolate reductase